MYIHCTKCDGSQDDFYHKGYNLKTKIIDDIRGLGKPRMISLDDGIIEDITKYTKVPVFTIKLTTKSIGLNKEILKFRFKHVFSGNGMIVEIAKDIKVYREMKGITYESYINDPIKECPNCHNMNCFVED